MRFEKDGDKQAEQIPAAFKEESVMAYREFQDTLSRLPEHERLIAYFNNQMLAITFCATMCDQKTDAQVAREIRDIRDLMAWIIEVSTPEEALVRLRRQHNGPHINN